MFGTKKKLMAAVVMLVISAIMLTSASYAWFTISTNPEISGLDTKVVVHEALEIALVNTDGDAPNNWGVTNTLPAGYANQDEYKQYTWGNMVDLGEVAYYNAATFDKSLRPAKLKLTNIAESGDAVNVNLFKYPEYDVDGRVSNLSADNLTPSDRNMGFGNLFEPDAATTGTKRSYGYYVDFWIRSGVDGDLVLSAAANRSTGSTTTDVNGGGSYYQSDYTYPASTNGNEAAIAAAKELAENIRVAFQDITSGVKFDDPEYDPIEVHHSTNTPTSGNPYITTFTTTKEGTTTPIIKLTRNVSKLIRMYVYLDGEGVTNLAASSLNDVVKGTLNMQFGLVYPTGHAKVGQPVEFANMNDDYPTED
jgi:hypothetical protein